MLGEPLKKKKKKKKTVYLNQKKKKKKKKKKKRNSLFAPKRYEKDSLKSNIEILTTTLTIQKLCYTMKNKFQVN